MNMITLYHNPKYSKSRQALQLLQDSQVDFEIINYVKTPLAVAQIKNLSKKLEMTVGDLLRKKEPEYKDLGLINQSEEALIQAMHEVPKLMERPIVETSSKAVIGRPTENTVEFIKAYS